MMPPMSRWSDRYRLADPSPGSVHSVSTVNGATDPASVIEAAYGSAERSAIIAKNEHGNPMTPIPHTMPPSWADPLIEPIQGAVCRCCKGRAWWCEAINPRGWRCARCYPGDHLPADRRRDVMT
jgi:hypothetical protein